MKKTFLVLVAVSVLIAATAAIFQRNRSEDISEVPRAEQVGPGHVSGGSETAETVRGNGGEASGSEAWTAEQLQMLELMQRMAEGTASDADRLLLDKLAERLLPDLPDSVRLLEAIDSFLYSLTPEGKAEAKAKIAKWYLFDLASAERYVEWAAKAVEKGTPEIERSEEDLKKAQEASEGAEVGLAVSRYRRFLKAESREPYAWEGDYAAEAAEVLRGPAEQLLAAAEKRLAASKALPDVKEKYLFAAKELRDAWVQSKDAYLAGERWTSIPDEVRAARAARGTAREERSRAVDEYRRADAEYDAAEDVYDAAVEVAEALEELLSRKHFVAAYEDLYAGRPDKEGLIPQGQKALEATRRWLAFREDRLAFYRSGQEETYEDRKTARTKARDLDRAADDAYGEFYRIIIHGR